MKLEEEAYDMFLVAVKGLNPRERSNVMTWMLGWMSEAQPEALIGATTAWYVAGSPR